MYLVPNTKYDEYCDQKVYQSIHLSITNIDFYEMNTNHSNY